MDDALEEHDAVWAIELAKALVKEGHSKTELFTGTGLDASILKVDEFRAPISKIAKLFENASLVTDNEVLGFEIGQTREFKTAGLLAYVGAASADVGQLLSNISRYRRVVGNSIELSVDKLQNSGSLSWRYAISDAVERRQFIEFNATGILSGLRKLTGRNIYPLAIKFRHSRNSRLKDFDRFFGCNVEFGCTANEMIFKDTDLSLPIRSADGQLLKILKGYCDQILASRETVEATLTYKIERLVSTKLASGQATLKNVAAELGMSERTLSRKLSAEKTSFREIAEELRFALAKKYLIDGGLPIIEITYLLGYSDVSSFSTAFRGWSGMSPGKFKLSH